MIDSETIPFSWGFLIVSNFDGFPTESATYTFVPINTSLVSNDADTMLSVKNYSCKPFLARMNTFNNFHVGIWWHRISSVLH